MEFLTMKKKIELLEHAFAASVGAYYTINLTKDFVPGSISQFIDGKEYSVNEVMGLPENARFSEIAAGWGAKLAQEQQPEYFDFLSIPQLLRRYQAGESHVSHRFWTQSAIHEPMLAEQHILMYTDEVTGDVMALSYVLDLTQQYKEEQYKKELEARQVRLEAALEEARQARKAAERDKILTAVDDVLDNITAFDRVTNEAELNEAMPQLLAALGKYSRSDRAYVFAWASEDDQVLRMTHEWCAPGVGPTIQEMQSVKMSDMPHWSQMLNRGEPIVSMDWEAERESVPEEFAVFDGQGIHALIVIPIFASKRLNGYIGFDNPDERMQMLSVRLLTSIGVYIGGLKENLSMMAELESKQHVLQNSLRELNNEKNILDALSIDYTSVYYCDLLADTLLPLKQGEYTNSFETEHRLTGMRQSYSFRIQYYFDHYVVQESAPDFLEKMSAENLMQHLAVNQRFAYRFRAQPNRAGQQYFEVQIVRMTGAEGFKVVMGYRFIDDLITEHERQKTELENALAVATLNSEIIGAISKLYWLIYRMDLVQGTYEEISAGSEVHRLTGKRGRTDEVFKEVRETVVVKEHQRRMEKFLDTSTLAQRLRNKETVETEYQAIGGSWHLARFIVKKRDADGRVTNVLYVVRQIDEQKQRELEYRQKLEETAEDARRANMAKTDFLRRMSHDIRTPINGIQGMVKIAEHFPEDTEKQRECRDKVKEASGFLLELVNSVLDMNKLESGKVVLEHKAFELDALLAENRNIIEMNAALKGLHVTFDHTKVRHTHLLGSPVHLKQILQNIAGNAVKYTDEGGSVHLFSEEVSGEGGKPLYRFTCTDTGRGMSEEFVQHAFEPFAQEVSSARTSYTGTGLGLAIAKQLVEMMQGKIEIKSKLNVGTTFIITIPLEVNTAFEKQEKIQQAIPANVLSGVKVLLAEDNEINMEIATFLLENAGMQVTPARDGQQAVDTFAAAKENAFDIILMDVMMPVMDGLEATRTIRSLLRPDAGTIPIFAMTANAFAEDIQRSREAGMNEHLSKPLDETKLMSLIKQYLYKQ